MGIGTIIALRIQPRTMNIGDVMTYSLFPALLYLLFCAFEEIQVRYMELTLKASALDLAPMDTMLWLVPPISSFTKLFLTLSRPMRWGFLIYLGFQTVWFYPAILFALSIVTSILFVKVVQSMFGLRMPAILGYLVMPISGTWMWLSL